MADSAHGAPRLVEVVAALSLATDLGLGPPMEHGLRSCLIATRLADALDLGPDQRMLRLGLPKIYGSSNPLAFMELQDVQELSNFFERKVSAYQVGVTGVVGFDEDF